MLQGQEVWLCNRTSDTLTGHGPHSTFQPGLIADEALELGAVPAGDNHNEDGLYVGCKSLKTHFDDTPSPCSSRRNALNMILTRYRIRSRSLN